MLVHILHFSFMLTVALWRPGQSQCRVTITTESGFYRERNAYLPPHFQICCVSIVLSYRDRKFTKCCLYEMLCQYFFLLLNCLILPQRIFLITSERLKECFPPGNRQIRTREKTVKTHANDGKVVVLGTQLCFDLVHIFYQMRLVIANL